MSASCCCTCKEPLILSRVGSEVTWRIYSNDVSTHWIANLFERQAVGDFGGSFSRSLALGLAAAALTVMIATLASYAFRRRFTGAALVFYLAVTRLIVPSILVSLGIGLMFRIMDWQPA